MTNTGFAMRLIVIPDLARGGLAAEATRLKQALSAHPLNLLIAQAARRTFSAARDAEPLASDIAWVVPPSWDGVLPPGEKQASLAGLGAVPGDRAGTSNPWLILSNGRFATWTDRTLVDQVLAADHADVVAIQVRPQLRAHRERICLTSQGELVGCRRLYQDVTEPAPLPVDWPHHLFLRSNSAGRLLDHGSVGSFQEVQAGCRALGLKIRSFAVAGVALDLASAQGVQSLCGWMLNQKPPVSAVSPFLYDGAVAPARPSDGVARAACLVGPILVGRGARVEAGAVVVGPAVLCDNSTVGARTLVDASVVGPGVTVEAGRQVMGACLLTPADESSSACGDTAGNAAFGYCGAGLRPRREFRTWPRLSYARCLKRVADILMALFVILLFAPIIPFIALAIRLNSPGPIFYKDRRQGLHGRPFSCIKFRTMRVGAAAIQDKLRFVSEVDGPQFKINDDPRISGVGRFLRNTSIDEIPQFFNVLVGQMSVVGPRPSPEAENTQCPSWRDARLSVRPGITGLWQVRRTRQPFKDFQEWIHYDTKYVRELSLRNDLWICVQTFRHLFGTFVEQF